MESLNKVDSTVSINRKNFAVSTISMELLLKIDLGEHSYSAPVILSQNSYRLLTASGQKSLMFIVSS